MLKAIHSKIVIWTKLEHDKVKGLRLLPSGMSRRANLPEKYNSSIYKLVQVCYTVNGSRWLL
jgi:hypothetical protein